MKQTIQFSPPPHPFVVVSDLRHGEPPEFVRQAVHIWSTRSCIALGCRVGADGETELVLSDDQRDAQDEAPAYDGVLETPRRILEVSTSEREVFLHCDVEGHFTRVRVWTDHPTEPDHILVVLG